MILYGPICKRLVSRNTLHEAAELSIGLILVEGPPLEKSTRRLLLQIGSLLFLCFLLNSVTGAVPHYESQAGQQESGEPGPGSTDDGTGSIFLQHGQSLNTYELPDFLI